MKAKIIIYGIILGLILFSSCKKDETETESETEYKDIKLSAKQQEIANSGNVFSLGILQKVSASQTSGNFMISPLSIDYALAMTANGAKNNTLNEMLSALDFNDFEILEFNEYFSYLMSEIVDIDSEVELKIANSIWYRNDYSFLQSFFVVNQEYYKAYVKSLDFASSNAVSEINNWVSDNTNNKITKIIDGIPSDAVMYLINAVYFYGSWQYEFDKSNTQKQNFYLEDGNSVSVDMMEMETGLKYYYTLDYQVVEIPYGQGNFVMDVILPAANTDIGDFVSNLNSDLWIEITQGLYSQNMVLKMPKFKFEYEKELNPSLQEMGIIDLFTGNADLSGMNGTGGLYVSKVKHKTYIDVNEEGTEVAAVTAVEVSYTSADPDAPLFFTLDKPFIFIIREKSTGVILFEGVMRNPLED
ncbi:MAG: serpin family protein [Bacteroidales bacterium]|nr:serpin family protein [Bacteroidales bacterium]MDD4216923.1 serpin family protein [Bacteroidales bacterium]MDY0141224.1 serpin family protein [Bacteroidales bacterium]